MKNQNSNGGSVPNPAWRDRTRWAEGEEKMAKKEFVGSMMIGAGILEKLANAVLDAGGKEEDLRRIETDSNLRKQIAELVAEGPALVELIKDCRFDYVNLDITEKNFPITNRPSGEVEMKVFHFNQVIGSDEAIREMEKEGYRPAELPEALAYAKANPDEQRKHPIVILGSVWRDFDGDRVVPCLDEWDGDRELRLPWYDRRWHGDCRFLAVRK